jgi:hypothetical protein
MLLNLCISVIPVLDKASELSPVKNESSYRVADPGRAQTKRYYVKEAERTLTQESWGITLSDKCVISRRDRVQILG